MLKLMGKKVFTILCSKNCLSKPMHMSPMKDASLMSSLIIQSPAPDYMIMRLILFLENKTKHHLHNNKTVNCHFKTLSDII